MKAAERGYLVGFTEAWNANCDTLPKLKKPPESKSNRELVLRAMRYFDGDDDALARAIRRCAANRDYRENRWGFASFCRHVEDRWGAEPTRAAPILHLSADERAKIRQEVSSSVREMLQAGLIPYPSDFDPHELGYLDEALAEHALLIERVKANAQAVAHV